MSCHCFGPLKAHRNPDCPIHGDRSRVFPYMKCPRDDYSMDPLQGCEECGGVGYHHSIANPEFWGDPRWRPEEKEMSNGMETRWSCLVSVEVERKTDDTGIALDTITIEDVVLADSASDAMRQIGNVLKDLYGVDTSKSVVKKIDIKEAE